MHCLTDYDTKILIAFNMSLQGDKKFSEFLMQNGYPEFAVLSNAIDDEPEAIEWLQKYHCDFLSLFAAACRKDPKAMKWFADNDLKLFIMMIANIHNILMYQSWDSSDIHKFRRS